MDAARLNAIIGGNIRKRRKILGKSQKEVGKALGVTHQQIQKYECGKNGLTVSKLVRIAEILCSSWEELCTGTECPEDKWQPSPFDFHVLLRLGLAEAKTLPPGIFQTATGARMVLLEKALYRKIMELLAGLSGSSFRVEETEFRPSPQ